MLQSEVAEGKHFGPKDALHSDIVKIGGCTTKVPLIKILAGNEDHLYVVPATNLIRVRYQSQVSSTTVGNRVCLLHGHTNDYQSVTILPLQDLLPNTDDRLGQ